MDASKQVLQLTNRLKDKDQTLTSADQSKLDSMSEVKEKAKCRYLEAINHFNDHIKDNYVKVIC